MCIYAAAETDDHILFDHSKRSDAHVRRELCSRVYASCGMNCAHVVQC
jgi:hypothetical protein